MSLEITSAAKNAARLWSAANDIPDNPNRSGMSIAFSVVNVTPNQYRGVACAPSSGKRKHPADIAQIRNKRRRLPQDDKCAPSTSPYYTAKPSCEALLQCLPTTLPVQRLPQYHPKPQSKQRVLCPLEY